MKRLQGYKYELRPNGEQQRLMRRFAGSCRFAYNKALALQKERCDSGKKKLSYTKLCKRLTEWRKEMSWLADAPVHPLQQSLKDLKQAYQNSSAKRAAFPRFKKKGQHDSFRYPDPKQIKLDQRNSRIFLPKLGWVRSRMSPSLPMVAGGSSAFRPRGRLQSLCHNPHRQWASTWAPPALPPFPMTQSSTRSAVSSGT